MTLTRSPRRRLSPVGTAALLALEIWLAPPVRSALALQQQQQHHQLQAPLIETSPDMRPSGALALAAAASSGVLAQTSGGDDGALLPLTFTPLPLGSITASGWLLAELQTEAAGLAGHEHDFYKYVADSSWTGGADEYSDLNEGLPYWFNGLVPLAYSLDDPRLKAQVHSAATSVLARQASDGWIGPENGTARNFWARYPFVLGLTNLADANATWEQPVVGALQRFFTLMHGMLADNYTGYWYHEGDAVGEGDTTWGRVRYEDMVISLMWMYENHPGNMSSVLLDNMNFLINGSLSWNDWYNEDAYIFKDLWQVPGVDSQIGGPLYQYEHGVNIGQGLKAPAVDHRVTKNASLPALAATAVNWTFTYHGAASGTVLADERMDGTSPYTGSELCTAVETLFSLSYLYGALGVNDYADRAERTAFNAMPAMLTPDWWAHQYMEEPNQPWARQLLDANGSETTPFSTSSGWAQSFGLEPEYPCCTVNHPQGLPKFLMASYVVTGGGAGLAHTLLSPATANTTLAGGNAVSVACDTDYPFGNVLRYTVTAAKPFTFAVRVPAWGDPATSSMAYNNTVEPLSPDATTGLHNVDVPAGITNLQYTINAPGVRTEPRANDTVAVFYGALLYALEIGSSNTSTAPKPYNSPSTFYPAGYAPSQAVDYQMSNTTAWNYAIDPSSLSFQSTASNTSALANPIFAPGAPPMYISANACQIAWPLAMGVPGAVPTGDARNCTGPVESVRLVPYGSQKLHMAELPTLSLAGK